MQIRLLLTAVRVYKLYLLTKLYFTYTLMHAPVKAERTVDVKPLNFRPSPFSTALLKPISKMHRIALSLALDQANSLRCMNKRDILDHLT